MAKVKDEITTIKSSEGYVGGSFLIKSADNNGMVVKWLKDKGDGTADRQQKFIELDKSEAKTIPKYGDRTAVSIIMVNNPQ